MIERPCQQCGFDSAAFALDELPALLRANAATWAQVLDGEPAALRRRPEPTVWSALEYGCHVRDVYRLYTWRLQLMLTQDDPDFENWDQDRTAVEERYDLAEPGEVRRELLEAVEPLAVGFAAVGGEQWQRRGRRSDGAVFTVETFARYLLHDPVHHLADLRLAH